MSNMTAASWRFLRQRRAAAGTSQRTPSQLRHHLKMIGLRSGVFAVVARAQAEVETLLKKARKVLGAAAVPITMTEPAAPEESAAMEGTDGEPAATTEPAAVHMDSGAGGLAAMEVATASDEGSNRSYSDEDHFVGSPFDSDVADEED